MNFLPSSYINRYKTEVRSRLSMVHDHAMVSEVDLSHLPVPVQKYLHYAGAVGKPKVHNFRAVFTGSMKQKADGKLNTIWLNSNKRND